MSNYALVMICLMITLMGITFAYLGDMALAGVALGAVSGVVTATQPQIKEIVYNPKPKEKNDSEKN